MTRGRLNSRAITKLVREVLGRTRLFGLHVPDGHTLAELVIETAVHRAIPGDAAFARLIFDLVDAEPICNSIEQALEEIRCEHAA
jgi:hypothetical protein